MKTALPCLGGIRITILVTLAALSFGSPLARAADAPAVGEVLAAIHLVENPYDVRRPGTHGELGAYQFREATWRMHTAAPFVTALDRPASDAVAVKHYEWLRRELERAGRPATVYNIALAWNGGLGAVLRHRCVPATHDYAKRVNNLALEMHRGRRAAAR